MDETEKRTYSKKPAIIKREPLCNGYKFSLSINIVIPILHFHLFFQLLSVPFMTFFTACHICRRFALSWKSRRIKNVSASLT